MISSCPTIWIEVIAVNFRFLVRVVDGLLARDTKSADPVTILGSRAAFPTSSLDTLNMRNEIPKFARHAYLPVSL